MRRAYGKRKAWGSGGCWVQKITFSHQLFFPTRLFPAARIGKSSQLVKQKHILSRISRLHLCRGRVGRSESQGAKLPAKTRTIFSPQEEHSRINLPPHVHAARLAMGAGPCISEAAKGSNFAQGCASVSGGQAKRQRRTSNPKVLRPLQRASTRLTPARLCTTPLTAACCPNKTRVPGASGVKTTSSWPPPHQWEDPSAFRYTQVPPGVCWYCKNSGFNFPAHTRSRPLHFSHASFSTAMVRPKKNTCLGGATVRAREGSRLAVRVPRRHG